MKSDEIQIGYYKAGKFLISIQPIVFETSPIEDQLFFECLILEEANGYYKYINLYTDERFPFLKFNNELVTYNSYIERKSQSFPLWRLSRHSITATVGLCCSYKKP
jgi:hypothetical protein